MKNNFWKAIPNGVDYEVIPVLKETVDIKDTSVYTPEGAYTTFRTFNRYQVLRLARHFNRLEETSLLAGHEIHLERQALKKILVRMIDGYGEDEARVRITIDLTKSVGEMYIAVEPLHVPEAYLYREGINTVTAELHRDNPKAKLSNFLNRAESVRSQVNGNYEEILMIDDQGGFLEGLSSNFYAVSRGTLFTAEDGVLSGTTRDLVLKLAEELSVPIVLESYPLKKLPEMDEAFITSTSRSILPIRSINGFILTKTVPGPVTEKLMRRFAEVLDSQKESLLS